MVEYYGDSVRQLQAFRVAWRRRAKYLRTAADSNSRRNEAHITVPAARISPVARGRSQTRQRAALSRVHARDNRQYRTVLRPIAAGIAPAARSPIHRPARPRANISVARHLCCKGRDSREEEDVRQSAREDCARVLPIGLSAFVSPRRRHRMDEVRSRDACAIRLGR